MSSRKQKEKAFKKLKKTVAQLKAKRKGIKALASAALALQSLGLAPETQAQTRPEEGTLRFQYVDYLDYQDNADRIRVKGPMAALEVPVGETWFLEGSFIYDSVSGASPLYLNTVSGASAKGIDDTRRAGDLKVSKYFDRFSVTLGGAFSDEEDYTSYAGSVDTRVWSSSKNTVFNFGAAAGDDDISATNDPTLDESRESYEFAAGVTQILTQNSLFQVNFTYAHSDGYHSDPYKPFDNRPGTRDRGTALVRFNQYVPALDGSLHLDYRYGQDSWGLQTHLAELAWYQTLFERLYLRPSIRYYTQNEADFFRAYFPPDENDGFFSADQRLSAFGGITFGIRGYLDIGWETTFSVGYEYLIQKSEYRLGSNGTDEIEPFYARFFTVGLSKKFRL